jgi:putative nucleotidyltransferase with HDIG domain
MDKTTTILNNLMIEVQKNKDIIYISTVITEFQQAMSNPEVPIDKIAGIIEKDPGLTSAVLKTANSSFYGLAKKVATVKQAISVLGYRTLEKIFLTQTVSNSLKTQDSEISSNLWQHSLATAIASQIIVSIKNPMLSEQAFVAGLLHDIGKFILFNFKTSETNILIKKLENNPFQYSIPLEMTVYGLNHQEVGAFFAQQWQFPEVVFDSIKYHHNVDFASRNKEVIASVLIANNFIKALELGKSSSGCIELIPHWLWGFLGIKQKMIQNILIQTKDKFTALTAFME